MKRKKIKTMNNKQAITTYLSTSECKKQTKQRTETESWIWRAFDGAIWEDLGEWVKR